MGTVLGMDSVEPAAAFHFIERLAGKRLPVWRIHDFAFGAAGPNHLRGSLDERLEPRLGVLKLLRPFGDPHFKFVLGAFQFAQCPSMSRDLQRKSVVHHL